MPANGIWDLNSARLWEWMNQPLTTATALTLILPTWRIWWAPNASKWQMGFNLAFKGLTLHSVAQIHTSVTLLTSRDLAWSSGRLSCQHASQISAIAHISWDVTYVSSALHTLPVVFRNGGNAYWKSAPTDLFIWHQVTRLTLRRLTSYVYGAPILDVSRSHTTTQHSR